MQATTPTTSDNRPIRVLIVESSAVLRHLFSYELTQNNQITIAGNTPDLAIAWAAIEQHRPDVILLDAQYATDAMRFLRQVMQHRPTPTIVTGSCDTQGSRTAMDALNAGAVEWLCKTGPGVQLNELIPTLIQKVKSASGICAGRLVASNVNTINILQNAPCNVTEGILVIGAGTGGVQALTEVLTALPAGAPGAVIVQHMPARLTTLFANRLNEQCAVRVREAADGDAVMPGQVLLSPGGSHMLLRHSEHGYHVEVKDGPELLHQKPSIDVLFNSAAKVAGANAVGAILTGVGMDGAAGLMNMRRAGNHTLAQNQETCAAFDLPAEAIRRGAAEKVVPLQQIAPTLMELAQPATIHTAQVA